MSRSDPPSLNFWGLPPARLAVRVQLPTQDFRILGVDGKKLTVVSAPGHASSTNFCACQVAARKPAAKTSSVAKLASKIGASWSVTSGWKVP